MKVGEYVRTDNCIGKVYDICHKEEDYYKFIIENHGTLRICDSDYIVKSSPNIIDLIEVGDYVNGSYIYSIVEENKNTGQPRVLFTEEDGVLGSGDIKSVVTKEAFESMEYKVKE